MKKAASRTRPATSDGLLPEYRFDYGKSSPNRFASRLKGKVVAVVLDPDVAAVFPTSEAVNQALRVLASAAQKRVRVAKRASASKTRRSSKRTPRTKRG
jgi:hypothetical protein